MMMTMTMRRCSTLRLLSVVVLLLVNLVSGSTFGASRSVHQQQQQATRRTSSSMIAAATAAATKTSPITTTLSAIAVRGGADESDDDDESGVSPTAVETALDIGTRVLEMVGKATMAATKVISRSLTAAFAQEEEDEVQDEATVFSRVLITLQRMYRAAVTTPPDCDDEAEVVVARKKSRKKSKKRSQVVVDDDDDDAPSEEEEQPTNADFGQMLARQYDVADGRNPDALPIMGGSLSDALLVARSKARLLVAYVPAAAPSSSRRKKTQSSPDQLAVQSLLSAPVSKVTEKKARKSATTPGSFVLWMSSSPAGSPDAVASMKRLKVKQPPGNKKTTAQRPTLCVVYPAQVFSSRGIAKIVPRLLAQHHCSPPPTPDTMAAWLNALRKRHGKQFAAMHHEQREAQLFHERKEGYKSSIVDDVERRQDEQDQEAARLAALQAEEERLEALAERRETLKGSLPDEPDKDQNGENGVVVMTIALRFTDGRAGQRRFDSSTPVKTVFNWVDAHYGMERERITLTTMNGQTSFSWDDLEESQTLGEAGLGRMTGLRVNENKAVVAEEEDDTDNEKDDSDDNDDEES